jgi:hypothetical protein
MVGEGYLCVVLAFSFCCSTTEYSRHLLISNLSTSVKGGDVGIVEFIRERVADVLRACRGRVALSGNLNVSDVSREFLALSNLYPLVSTLVPNCPVD